ncbi:hypothetical protein B6N60_02433 [Richelia sinica FACHB-800]|uniref:Uncharacterized protein n=1 Tax=Richelia sinica FACHB-800 TaxID=1357546 RepID=A0A975Y513_9NOST|nr:hypothetical protein B6N60_02433 [Richelia sinica FACHB-800]
MNDWQTMGNKRGSFSFIGKHWSEIIWLFQDDYEISPDKTHQTNTGPY